MRTLAALVIAACLGAGAGPASAEVTGDGGAARVADPFADRGRIAEAALARRSTLVVDDPLHRYLMSVLCRLSAAQCAGVRLYLLDDGGFDLRVSADGAIALQAGTLLRVRDEDELAVLLGHELAHLDADDARAREQARKGRERTALARRQEREADARGRELAATAGYDPGSAATLWSRLAAEAGAARRAPPRHTPYATPEQRAAAAPAAGPRSPASAERFRAAVEPHLEAWLGLALDEPDVGATIAMLTALHRDVPAGWRGRTGLALAEAHRRRGRAGDAAVAAGLVAEARPAVDAPGHGFRISLGPPRAMASAQGAAHADVVPGLRVLSDLFPREHLLARRRVDRDADPGGWFDPRRPLDDQPRMLLAALRDAGWVDLRVTSARMHRFGALDGVRFEYRLAAPDGTPHAGSAAMAVHHGRLTVAYWQAPMGPGHEVEAVRAAAALDSLRLK